MTQRDPELSKLRRELSRLDTVLFLISAMVVVDTIGAIAIGGVQAFTWLVVLFVLFFVPSALISAELGAALPEEGGVYVWVRMAFGRFAGAMTSMLYWAGTPMWLGGSVAAVAITVYGRFLGDLSRPGMFMFGTVFVLLATTAAVVPLRWGKWVPASGAVGQIVLLGVFTVSVVAYGVQHGMQGMSLEDFSPTRAVFIAVVPVLLYSFVGVELPTTAAEEMHDPRRDIPAAIGTAGVAQALMYGVPILAVLIVLPRGQITSLHGLIDAMKTVYTVYGGNVSGGEVTLTGAGALLGVAERCGLHLGPHRQRFRLDHGRRPCPGRRVPGWRRPTSPGSDLRTQRRTGRDGSGLGWGLVAPAGPEPVGHRRGQPEVLLGRPQRGHLADRAGLPLHLPGFPQAPLAHTPISSGPSAYRAARSGPGCSRSWRPPGLCWPPSVCCGRASGRPTRTTTCLPASRGNGSSTSCSRSHRYWRSSLWSSPIWSGDPVR